MQPSKYYLMAERENLLGRALTIGQFLIGLAGVCITFGSFIWNMATINTRLIERQATQQEAINRQGLEIKDLRSAMEQHNQKIEDKMDAIKADIGDIKILIQNKQDRR
jgi:hypothetical protein